MPTEVVQETAQKDPHIRSLNIFALESEVKCQVLLLGRDGKGRDGQNFVSPVEMMQDGILPSRCPCSANTGDEKKPALLKKRQMGSKCDSFFLLPANVSSSVLSPLLPLPEPVRSGF